MKIVWRLHSVTVRDVYEALRTKRRVAYTTVMTMMNILETKGYLKKDTQDRAYRYRPARPERAVITAMVREFVSRVFDGAPRPLLLHLLSDDEREEFTTPLIESPAISSQVSRVRRRIPSPSAPSTNATRRPAKNGPDNGLPEASRPTHQTLAAFSAIKVRAILTARSNGIVSRAPDAALASEPVSSGALRSWVITAAAPNAAAERMIAPILRGSVT